MALVDDWEILARTVYGEARGEPFEGQVAVAWVVKNRAQRPGWWGHTIETVCRAPLQFSCWNQNDPNRAKVLTAQQSDPNFLRALGIAALVILGNLPDYSRGGTHYFSSSIPPPEWSKAMVPTVTIGGHKFYQEAL